MSKALVWVLPEKKLVIVSEDLSPFTEGYAVGVYHTPKTFGWGLAGDIARFKAKELGFTVDYRPLNSDLAEEDGTSE